MRYPLDLAIFLERVSWASREHELSLDWLKEETRQYIIHVDDVIEALLEEVFGILDQSGGLYYSGYNKLKIKFNFFRLKKKEFINPSIHTSSLLQLV